MWSTANSRQQQLNTRSKFFCKQSGLPQDAISEVFLSMVKLVFYYVLNVTVDVQLSAHYVKFDRHKRNGFKNRCIIDDNEKTNQNHIRVKTMCSLSGFTCSRCF
ncbi:hypothetical protein BgiMline_026042 [Biomphalaria glabrata]|nr:hypothetical protein BgiMline_031251 [Biomphalaria glabrata]